MREHESFADPDPRTADVLNADPDPGTTSRCHEMLFKLTYIVAHAVLSKILAAHMHWMLDAYWEVSTSYNMQRQSHAALRQKHA